MTNFIPKTTAKHDCYMTPTSAWDAIDKFIPEGSVIWEPFMGDGSSGKHLEKLGYKVFHNNKDFFEYTPDAYDIIVTNPPFSKSKDVMNRLRKLDKPFILIMPSAKLITSYFRENFKDTDKRLQILIPRKRIHFIKHQDGKPVKDWKPQTCYECYYYIYGLNLPRDITWLE
tara:strand:- start:3860 stop:4372 length:513 start_codon:yes stop_codon:yes gene_type:complete